MRALEAERPTTHRLSADGDGDSSEQYYERTIRDCCENLYTAKLGRGVRLRS